MRKNRNIGLLAGIFTAAISLQTFASAGEKLAVSVFTAKEANVNAYVFSDSMGTLIVDTTRNSKEAHELAALAKSKGAGPNVIFITHGHPDHYLGMGALKKEFPQAKIVVATQKIKEDIIGFTKFMESVKWLEGEPSMKPKSEANPNGFDYENEITVLDTKDLILPAGSHLEVQTGFPVTESPNETVLFSKELNSVFASDLAYNKVHLWLGVGVDQVAIKNWKNELAALKRKYAPLKSKVYPGHGSISDAKVFDVDQKYISALLSVVKKAKDRDEAKAAMVKAYPDWLNSDFLLVESIKFQIDQLKK